MILIAKAVGAAETPFFGTAGIGDLIATTTSPLSRNYTFGTKLAEGKTVDQIFTEMEETAEGYRTINFAHRIVQAADIKAPMITTLYEMVYNGLPMRHALMTLLQNRLSEDVDFL